MKNISVILSHLKNNPEFRKINTNKSIQQLIDVLPLKLKKGIKFAYIKRQILFFVLTHPVYKMEFEYNKALIKSLLKTVKMENVENIQFFVTNKREKKVEKKVEEPSYKERSYGIFSNTLKDENLHNKLEEIRAIIKSS